MSSPPYLQRTSEPARALSYLGALTRGTAQVGAILAYNSLVRSVPIGPGGWISELVANREYAEHASAELWRDVRTRAAMMQTGSEEERFLRANDLTGVVEHARDLALACFEVDDATLDRELRSNPDTGEDYLFLDLGVTAPRGEFLDREREFWARFDERYPDYDLQKLVISIRLRAPALSE